MNNEDSVRTDAEHATCVAEAARILQGLGINASDAKDMLSIIDEHDDNDNPVVTDELEERLSRYETLMDPTQPIPSASRYDAEHPSLRKHELVGAR